MNSRATFESSHAGRIGAYAAGADGMSRSKSAPAPAAVILDPRAKLYLLLLANMLLFFHADAQAEALLTALFLTPLFLAGRWRMGLRLTACYAVLMGLGLWSDAATLDTAGASGAASASGSGADAWIHVVGLFSVGLRMMMPCFITGAYAFSTTRVSEFVCALRRMRVPESAAIPLHGGHPVLSDNRAGLPAHPRRDGPSRSCLRPTRAAAASGPVAGVRAGSAVDERDDRLA